MTTQTYTINGSAESTTAWRYWTSGTSLTIASSSSYTTCNGLSFQANAVWSRWVINGVGTTAISDNRMAYSSPKPLTEEELEARRVEAANAAEKSRMANERADALLAEFLSPIQKSQYDRDMAFIVETESGRCYEIKRGRRVAEVNEQGKAKAMYCIHPVEWNLPAGDVMLAQKLMLETDEKEFLRIANRTLVTL